MSGRSSMKHPQIGMTVPPLSKFGVDTKKLDNVLGKLEKFSAERRNAEGKIRGAEAELEEARTGDDRAYAAALKAGKSAPEQRNLEAAKEKLAGLERRRRALDEVIKDLTEEARQYIHDNAPVWGKAAEATLEKAATRYQEAIDELTAARGDYFGTLSAVKWAQDPSGKYNPKQPEAPVILGLDRGPGMGAPTEVQVSPILAALRYEAAAHERQRGQEARPGVSFHRDQPQVREAG